MRLIDADALYEYICGSINKMTKIEVVVDGEYLWGLINEGIEHAPTIEPSRQKGEWKRIGDKYPSGCIHYANACNQCGNRISEWTKYNFCPNCGADMRGANSE